MKAEKLREMSLLLDFYQGLLSERQRELCDYYYNDDLSHTEIAANTGITRQGVRDVIVRAEAILTEIEDKTHLIRRFHEIRRQSAEINAISDKLVEYNQSKGQDFYLEQLAQELKLLAEQLGKE